MRARRRFVPRVDFLLSRIVLDAGASGAVASAASVQVSNVTTSDQVAVTGSTAPTDDSDDTGASPVVPVNPMS